MESGEQIRLAFDGVDIYNVVFEAYNLRAEKMELEVNIESKVFYPKSEPNAFQIIMDTTVESKDYFALQLRAVGNFRFGNDIEEQLKKPFVNFNAPAIMFPYLRSFITSFTSSLGSVTGSLVIPPRFFDGELEEITFDEDVNDIEH